MDKKLRLIVVTGPDNDGPGVYIEGLTHDDLVYEHLDVDSLRGGFLEHVRLTAMLGTHGDLLPGSLRELIAEELFDLGVVAGRFEVRQEHGL